MWEKGQFTSHVTNILSKREGSSRLQALVFVVRHGVVKIARRDVPELPGACAKDPCKSIRNSRGAPSRSHTMGAMKGEYATIWRKASRCFSAETVMPTRLA